MTSAVSPTHLLAVLTAKEAELREELAAAGVLDAQTGDLEDALDEVLRARARLEAGRYGSCEVCEAEIPGPRLEARPWSTRCLQHA